MCRVRKYLTCMGLDVLHNVFMLVGQVLLALAQIVECGLGVRVGSK